MKHNVDFNVVLLLFFGLGARSCYEMLDLPIPIHLKREEEFTEIKSWEANALDLRDGTVKPLPPGRYYLKGVWLGRPLIKTGLISVDIV